MIMSMCNVICVTNRRLSGARFLEQVERAASAGVSAVILREKDLPEAEYEGLARQVKKICEEKQVPLILHTYMDAALRLGIHRIHLPIQAFLNMNDQQRKRFDTLGVSTHSVEEAVSAWKGGASYVTAGHIFTTDCKKGVPPRGLSFLEEVCHSVDIPVYAIGGVNQENRRSCLEAGAAGVCLMSAFMKVGIPGLFF